MYPSSYLSYPVSKSLLLQHHSYKAWLWLHYDHLLPGCRQPTSFQPRYHPFVLYMNFEPQIHRFHQHLLLSQLYQKHSSSHNLQYIRLVHRLLWLYIHILYLLLHHCTSEALSIYKSNDLFHSKLPCHIHFHHTLTVPVCWLVVSDHYYSDHPIPLSQFLL